MTEGGTVTRQKNLAHYVRGFYEHLYASEALDLGTGAAQEDCWASTPVRVSSDMNSEMTRELSLKEIQEAISAMPKDKAPGANGIPTEFFQELSMELAPTLLLAFKAMLNTGETSKHINKGTITLIPKSGDHFRIGN